MKVLIRTLRKYDFTDIMKWIILTLTPNEITRCQFGTVAMFGVKLKVLKNSGIFYDLNEAYPSQNFHPTFKWSHMGSACIFSHILYQIEGLGEIFKKT